MDKILLQAAPLENETNEETLSLKLVVDDEIKGNGEIRIVNSIGEISNIEIIDEDSIYSYALFLKEIEKWAMNKKLTSIHINMINNNFDNLNNVSDKEKSLLKLDWIQNNSQNVFIYDAIKLSQDKWFNKNYLNDDFTIESIMTMTNEEKKEVEAGKNNWYPERFYPLQYNQIGKNSLIMKYKGELIGWCITTIVGNNLLMYDNLYVKKEFWNLGRSISLLTQSIQIQCNQSPFRYLTCTISGENQPLLKLLQNKTKDYLVDYKELKLYEMNIE